MIYIISDVHNDNKRFRALLEQIEFSEDDHLYIIGDLFDRCDYAPDPVGVWFTVLGLGDRCTVIRGNHDQWLATYILDYFCTPEHKRVSMKPYPYNSFSLMTRRLTPVDLCVMARRILSWDLQNQLEVGGQKYLLAHAMTSSPEVQESDSYYLMGAENTMQFLEQGVDGYISIVGHQNPGREGIWRNKRGNVIAIDCGCGFRSGRLACLCLETEAEFMVD